MKTGAGCVAGASFGLFDVRSAARAQTAGGETLTLSDDFHVLTLGQTNVLAVTAGEGIALVDGGPASESRALMEMIAALPRTGKVHTLFNTHWHPEQTGSNEELGKAGATIVAHENTRLWLTTDVTWPWNNETVEPLAEIARPNKTFYAQEELIVGDKRVQCGHLRDCPHTDGDMYVFFPDENVLAVGDAVTGTGAGWPSIDWWTGGWIGGIVGGIDMLFAVANAQTRIVPARGPVLSRDDLRTQYQMYSAIWERLARTLYGGGGPEEAIAANPTKEFNDIMGNPDEFVRRAFQSLWAYLSPDA
ncbi:MAG TPA: MBL fold metallo-hydrolase [Gammaproteobacteria bacterium]|nr:MBL fold metallo-hydrolase [Gammaproteobacteria bacterium]